MVLMKKVDRIQEQVGHVRIEMEIWNLSWQTTEMKNGFDGLISRLEMAE